LLLSKNKNPGNCRGFFGFQFGMISFMSNTKNTRPLFARGGDGNGGGCC
jgi:hypothetical protein